MNIEIIGVGGYNEVGKNMTVVRVGDEAVIIDCGFYLPSLVDFEEGGGDRKNLTPKGLQKIGAIPDDSMIKSMNLKVKAIVSSHCHLDHIGAIPYLENQYNAPIIGTPYTMEVLRNLAYDEKIKLKNKLLPTKPGKIIEVSKNIQIELINMTHSTLEAATIAIHTPKGVILYTNDFKLDNHPVLGKKPDYARLRKLGSEGKVLAIVIDSLYSKRKMKTPSEKVARELLKDVMLGIENQGNALFVTSFASHIARVKSAIEFGKKLDRKIVFMGRSLSKYSKAAENIGLVNFSKDAEILTYSRQVEKKLHQIEKHRDKYLVIATGSQAEPNAILTRIGDKKLPFNFAHDDSLIFSCKTIPVEPNIQNREKLENQLSRRGVRIFKDIHVSGHCSIEDIRDVIGMTKPELIIPGHGGKEIVSGTEKLANFLGYKTGKGLKYLENNKKIVL
jgi:ribonuclease J